MVKGRTSAAVSLKRVKPKTTELIKRCRNQIYLYSNSTCLMFHVVKSVKLPGSNSVLAAVSCLFIAVIQRKVLRTPGYCYRYGYYLLARRVYSLHATANITASNLFSHHTQPWTLSCLQPPVSQLARLYLLGANTELTVTFLRAHPSGAG